MYHRALWHFSISKHTYSLTTYIYLGAMHKFILDDTMKRTMRTKALAPSNYIAYIYNELFLTQLFRLAFDSGIAFLIYKIKMLIVSHIQYKWSIEQALRLVCNGNVKSATYITLSVERIIYVLLYKVVKCKYAISHINKGFFATIQCKVLTGILRVLPYYVFKGVIF